MKTILGISGSLRQQSHNTALLRAIQQLLPESCAMEIVTPPDMPIYNEEIQHAGWPESVLKLAQQIRQADLVIIATPEYNYSIPGGLKNVIDWISRLPDQPFKNKPIGIVGASSGRMGSIRAQLHLRQCFQFLDARIMSRPEVLIGSAQTVFTNGELTDFSTRNALQDFVDALLIFGKTQAHGLKAHQDSSQ